MVRDPVRNPAGTGRMRSATFPRVERSTLKSHSPDTEEQPLPPLPTQYSQEMMSSTDSVVLQWDEEYVNDWLSSIGYQEYHDLILEHGISGEVLIHLDFDTLREIGITSAGHRLDILKAIYRLKLDSGIPIEPEHYIPLSESNEDVFPETTPLGRLMQLITAQNERIRQMEAEIQRLTNGVVSLEECVLNGKTLDNGSGSSLQKQPSLKWAKYGKTVKSPTKPMPDDSTGMNLQAQDSPRVSPQALEHDLSSHASKPLPRPQDQDRTVSNTSSLPPYGQIDPPPPTFSDISQVSSSSRAQSNGATESRDRSRTEERSGDNMFQSFRVSLDDPCSKVLPAALKKYKITDDWRMYALFICYGNTERCLSLDEKPLLLFKKLKDAQKNPVFMLRHVRDIRAPITMAQNKQTDKRSGSSGSGDASQPMKKLDKVANTPYTRDTRLHQTPTASLQPISVKGYSAKGNSGFYENGVDDMDRLRSATEDGSATGNGLGHTDAIITWTGISYAIAIYPYGRDYDDEFDVTVGAMFVVLRRSKGWWQVQRDSSGIGAVDERSRKAWVPAGCLLETSVPLSTAISEAAMSLQPMSPSAQSLASPTSTSTMSDAPVLPSSIVSTSYPGIALMDWVPQGDHELDLIKDDMLRVFKRYNHWSYVVKETGRRGWVPSWLIGKVASGSANPATPGTALSNYDGAGDDSHGGSRGLTSEIPQINAPPNGKGELHGLGYMQAQPSPMSPGFSMAR